MSLTVTNTSKPLNPRYQGPHGYLLRKKDESGDTRSDAEVKGMGSMNGMASNGQMSQSTYQAPRNVTAQPVGGATTFTGDPNPSNPAAVSNLFDGGGDYDSYINKSFDHAMRTLDPMIQQNEDRFNQGMIDRGLSAGGEAYGQAFDNNSRRYNDLLSAAAYNAMNFGANRLDSDRQYGLNRDIFDLNELSTVDGINRSWNQIDYRDAVFNTGREDQQFNQMLSMFGFTPVGSTNPVNTAGAFANNVNAQQNAQNAANQGYGQAAQGVTDAIGAIDWGGLFKGWGFGNGGSGGLK